MEKPKIRILEYYDYNDCADYIEDKYGLQLRNYETPYGKRDFWMWLVQKCDLTINGQHLTLIEEYVNEEWNEEYNEPPEEDEWKYYLAGIFFDEFGVGEPGKRLVNFYAWW